jgi:hypothetical protein
VIDRSSASAIGERSRAGTRSGHAGDAKDRPLSGYMIGLRE